MFGYLCLRKKKICLWKHLEESWEPIEHCVSFKLRCISMFDTLMLCWTTSASSSHFLASIFLWIWKCRACFLERKMSGYTQTDLVSDTSILIGLHLLHERVAKRPLFCKPQLTKLSDGWMGGRQFWSDWMAPIELVAKSGDKVGTNFRVALYPAVRRMRTDLGAL